jgi:flagellar biosynthesis protein
MNVIRRKAYREQNGPLKATALGYNPDEDIAPRVLAQGQGKIAEQILEIAREKGIPIQEDPLLASALAQLDIDETIPPELYQVVAELLAYVMRVQRMLK